MKHIGLFEGEGFINPAQLPPRSTKLMYFSPPLLLLVGKRKYRGCYSFYHKRFYKDGFHTENYSFETDKVNGWKLR